jgi:hypothetical protein
MPRSNTTAGPIVVAGDVSIDWLAWPQQADNEAGVLNWRQREGTRMVARRGGALLLTDLLRKATKRMVIDPLVDEIALKSPDHHLHSMVDLEPLAGTPKRFGISRFRGFCGPQLRDPLQPSLQVKAKRVAALVLDDSGNGFRRSKKTWNKLIAKTRPRWLIVKMARPLADGPMWNRVRRGPIGDNGASDPERLIVVLNADDLRDEKIALSRRLSWERTAEDFVRELGSNGALASLVTCAHLIVRFDCDGVIHYRGQSEDPVLYFDPGHAEGEFVESTGTRMMGMTDAFTAGLAAALADDKGPTDEVMERAIKRGMTASHRIATAGFQADADGAPDYPHTEAMRRAPERSIESLNIPRSGPTAAPAMWSILDDQLGDATNAARRVVAEGPEAALAKVPVAQFGELTTADRGEIESYRAISNLLRDYLSMPQTKPISIAVFGPPGAGKSFGVQQVAEHARPVGSRKVPPLEFNLSQFTQLDDLIAAFHLVRDQALSDIVPLVFFDEFDSNFGDELDGKLGWLRYFLAPMQDGKFRERGHTHPLGGAIFVFAGGTRQNLKEFVKTKDDPAYEEFAAVKGPDFASRLRGHIDIRGPDPVNEHDRMFPIRRAFLLRSMLTRRQKLLKSGAGFNIDDGVLNALLTVPSYRHGARSMEALLGMSILTNPRKFDRASLPPTEQLESHVKAADFMVRVEGERLDDGLRDELGRLLHQVYRTKRNAIAENDAQRARLARDEAMKDWGDLPEMFRESSRLQADDIPRKLLLIDCFMAKEIPGRVAVEKFTLGEINRLAKIEHERYNAERLRQRWQLGARDPSKRKSPFLVPWDDLAPRWRSLDASAVSAIPSVLAQAGWRVYRKELHR